MEKIQTICIVTPTLTYGGAEKNAVNLANEFVKKHDVSIVVFKRSKQLFGLIDKRVRVFDLGVQKIRYVLNKLRKKLKLIKPDCVLSVMMGSNIPLGVLSFMRHKYCVVFREVSTMNKRIENGSFNKMLKIKLMQLSYRKADVIIANSFDTKKDLIKYRIAKDEKIVVLGNPVLPDNYKDLMREYVGHKWLDNDKYKVVLMVGRLVPAKNNILVVKVFSEIIKKIKEARLIIIGTGISEKEIQEKVDELKINEYVDMIGYRKNTYPYYNKSHLFILSSNYEGFGNVLVEALACGVKVVSTDCPGGPRDILGNGRYGRLVPVNNPNVMYETILSTLLEPDINRDERMAWAASFRADKIAEKYFDTMNL